MFVAAVLVTTLASAAEPEFLAAHAKAVAANPAGMSFSIEFAGRQSQFHVGELISLDIVYEFRQAGAYLINDGLASGSGTARLLEVFRVTPPAGTRSQTLDEPNFHRWAGGTPLETKTDHVYRYRVALNEWRRFDTPGRYRFYSESARVWKPRVSANDDNDLRVTSNLLELEITPATPEWQEEQLRQAIAVLDRPDDTTDDYRLLRREALRRLRYLDTEAATRELARRLSGRDEYEVWGNEDQYAEQHDVAMGLFRSLYKSAAVEELERRLEAPEFAVTADFVTSLARLAADARLPVDESAFGRDDESQAKLDRLNDEHETLEQTLFLKYSEAAWVAAEKKQPPARARTLLEWLPESTLAYRRDPQPPSAERLARVGAAVRAVFAQLPAAEQSRVLGQQWKRLGGTEFLPVLRRFIASTPERLERDYDRDSLVDLAFRRMIELAPEEGTALIQAELRRPRPRATMDTFKLLPARPIPELDDSLATRVEEMDIGLDAEELAATLAARFGSSAIYDRVRKVYGNDAGSWPCDYQAAMLAYLIRHNPREGAQLVNQALDATAPNQTRCFRSVLTDVARVHMSAELERIAIERLNDKNPEIASNAIWTLQGYGSAAAEQALWRRFEKWHDTWKDRVGELTVADNGSQTAPQVQLELSLIDALSHANNWITDRAKLERLRALCLTKRRQQHVDEMLDHWREPVAIHFNPGTDGEFPSAARAKSYAFPFPAVENQWWVTQYFAHSLADLKKLLARFPAGTTFGFPTGILTDPVAEQRLFDDLQESLAPHGMKLVKSPPRE